ncbi:hypothetical protein LOTGIDRAFT_152192 [Lottia gigantea]|uniref:Uncharacterized protein n=1 Tax=Lottia gigantea TaxID=225164 RepID=V4B4F8_LOTGI|nr:hypothetical protein LOTGIDRAFT_152192 [Lottia gigantea]ESP05348.1 hypothetical protein LOTGIDRAFT_152192 [Lottia gigantea]
MDKTEVLILEVEKNPVLFDKAEKTYKETVKKKDIWKGIGEKVGLTGSLNRYQIEKFSRKQDWDSLRDEIFQCYDADEVPESFACNLCQKTTDKIYRCCDCCQWQKLCICCLLQRHSYPNLHIFEEFKEKAFIECSTDTPIWRICHPCDTKYQKSMILVDDKGKQHRRLLEFCSCEKEAVTLTRYKFWPSSVRCPAVAFSFGIKQFIYKIKRYQVLLYIFFILYYIICTFDRILIFKHSFAGGQQIAIRLSKQIKACNMKIKDALPTYNELYNTNKTFKEITNQDELERNSIKQKACNLRLLIERAREEQIMVKEEMTSTYNYFEHQLDNLKDVLKETNSANREATIFKEGLLLEIKLSSLYEQFHKYVVLKENAPLFSITLSYEMKVEEICDDICDDICDEYDDDDVDDDYDNGGNYGDEDKALHVPNNLDVCNIWDKVLHVPNNLDVCNIWDKVLPNKHVCRIWDKALHVPNNLDVCSI